VNRVKNRINWLGLAGGVTTIVVIIVSFFYPWWRFSAWNDRIVINVSPVNTNFNFLGTMFTIPLIFALNIVSLLTLTASGISMLIYSVMPTKTYSKHLLGFAYKKPLFSLVFSVVVLFVITLIIQALFGFNVPLVGSSTANLPQNMTLGVTIAVVISAGFQWPFWLAAVAAGLCVAARLYHKKIATVQVPAAGTAPSAAATA
jgi:hypothetical protein